MLREDTICPREIRITGWDAVEGAIVELGLSLSKIGSMVGHGDLGKKT